MTDREKILLDLMDVVEDQNQAAVLLQSWISEFGPLSEETAAAVRHRLKKLTK